MNNDWYVYTKKGWEKMNKGFYLWGYFVIAGLLALLIIQTHRGVKIQRESLEGKLRCITVDLVYHHSIPEIVAEVSDDLREYLGWSFFTTEGVHTIARTRGSYYKNTIFIRGSQPARKAKILLLHYNIMPYVKVD